MHDDGSDRHLLFSKRLPRLAKGQFHALFVWVHHVAFTRFDTVRLWHSLETILPDAVGTTAAESDRKMSLTFHLTPYFDLVPTGLE